VEESLCARSGSSQVLVEPGNGLCDGNHSLEKCDLALVAGGARNIDNPVVKTVMDAFNATVEAAAAAQKDFYRTYAAVGSTPHL
jgi:hypothetical protein